MKKKVILMSVLICSLLLSACGSSSDKSAYYAGEAPAEAIEAEWNGGFAEEAKSTNITESLDESSEEYDDSARKLIKTYNLSAETEAFDDFLNNLDSEINALHGYIQNLDTYNGNSYSGRTNRYSNLTIRIPVKNLEAFVSFIGNTANITNKNLSVEDITLKYVDLESHKKSYEIEQERLLALLEKAETMEDIISLESRLSEVRYNLESMASQIRAYDNLVDYATVYLYVSEVTKYTEPEPESYGERIARSFTESLANVWEGLKDFLVWFVGAIPGLVIFAIIVTIIVLIIKAISKSRKKKLLKKEEERMNNAQKAMATAAQNAENNQN